MRDNKRILVLILPTRMFKPQPCLNADLGVSENQGVPYFEVHIIRILLFRASPIFGNSHVDSWPWIVQLYPAALKNPQVYYNERTHHDAASFWV